MRIKSLDELGKGGWKVNDAAAPATSSAKNNKPKKKHSYTGPSPQEVLWGLVNLAWPGLAELNFNKAVPGRKFEIDIAFVEQKVAVEVDGYRYHGLSKAGFHRDREKDKLLTINGWKILRFSAKEITKDGIGCLKIIETVTNIKSKIPTETNKTLPS